MYKVSSQRTSSDLSTPSGELVCFNFKWKLFYPKIKVITFPRDSLELTIANKNGKKKLRFVYKIFILFHITFCCCHLFYVYV